MSDVRAEDGAMIRRFITSPFSVLDTRLGAWLERKRAWLSLGIESELGRDQQLTFNNREWIKANAEHLTSAQANVKLSTTSIFDPVLTECLIEWFSPQKGRILDPFAGGSVRGIVAAKLGRAYYGIELRPEQVAANEQQRQAICGDSTNPEWICGDSRVMLDSAPDVDMILTCPPYGHLEVYSDNPADLSYIAKQDHTAFLTEYRTVVAKAAAKLANNRFAAYVVGDYRDNQGFYRNFTGETIAAHEACGLRYYNEAVLVKPAGTLALRVTSQMQASRKLGRHHQTVLVFVKGDPKLAAQACLANAPAELGYKGLPTVSKPKRSNSRSKISSGVSPQLPNEVGAGDGQVTIKDRVSIGPESGELSS